ncbi:MAG: prepilin-type N-terminal cleavage/methylation domain-containing protein [Burkholderiaceae bacterium]|nr:MAG: prepilin-type N-terminal cleavage/methylation domain-containing protein [Burkholderiaceae bacterium]
MVIRKTFRNAGVTLLELLVSILLLALLVLIAVPAYGDFMSRQRIVTVSAELHGVLLYSRSEAIKRGGNVILCRSSSTLSENPSCDKGSDATGMGWGAGWMIFHDKDLNHRYSAGDEILLMRARTFENAREGRILTKPSRNQLEFNGTGQVFATYMSFAVQRPDDSVDSGNSRYICIASGGRARISPRPCS